MKKALLISIGMAYPPPYQIPDPPNNLADFLRTLSTRGFSDMSIIQEERATRAAILSGMQSFVASLGPQDSGAIVFTGHGGRIADANGDESDHLDECIASVDLLPISDDTIQSILAQTSRPIDVVLDCCYPDNSDIAKRLWAAGRENQLDHAGMSGGVLRSVFSLYLCWALRAYPTKTAIEIMAIVAAYVTRAFPDQTPVLKGPDLSQIPF